MNPSRILELANAFWSSATLLSANELGVFGALGSDDASAAELAETLKLPARPLADLLDALAALGLLDKHGDRYRNSAEASAFLVPNRPGSLAGALRYNQAMFPAWARLTEAVRNDAPVVESPTYLGVDPERTRQFVLGMHGRAKAMGPAIAAAVDLSGCARLVDVGGGPGTLSAILCERHPDLRATVLELPAIAAVGRELIAGAGLAERVAFRDADVFSDDLGAGYDAALVSGLLHREPAGTCAELCQRLYEALEPGAAVHVVDVMRDESRVGPPFAALFALNMVLSSERGGCHADVDHVEWLTAAGFTEPRITRLPAPMVHTVVSATKPHS